jgi:hypothetical protein
LRSALPRTIRSAACRTASRSDGGLTTRTPPPKLKQ